jgi:uncharacterized protein YndB with AHSA1/START domain
MKNALGRVTKESDGYKVVFERSLNHNIQTVWDAITNPEKLKIWFTDFEMEFRKGGKLKILFRDTDKTVTHGEIISIDPPTKFVWTWEGELAVWELQSEGKNKCKLKLTYSKLADRYAVGAPAGFHSLLDQLYVVLEGRTDPFPFGTEENAPEQIELREQYGSLLYDSFPELQIFHPYKLERIYPAPISKVWSAITERDQLKKWYFDFAEDFKPEIDQEFEWYAGEPGCKQWLHRGKVTEVVDGKKLAHTWEYPGYTGKAKVIWELSEVSQSSTKVNFTFEILIPFDSKEEALKRKNFVQGWNSILKTSLEEHLTASKKVMN